MSSTPSRKRSRPVYVLPSLLLASSLFLPSVVYAQGTACGSGLASCPATSPCCSEYGYCGTSNLFCSQGCNPMWSNTPQSCAPLPLCVDQTTTFTDLSRVQQNASLWDGNATAYDWVINKGEMVSTGQEGVLKLTESNGGTKISSARYVHYGKISATLKTSSNVGVVTALITMSDVKDEIDFEAPGAPRDQFQTNWFSMGLANYSASISQTIHGLDNTYDNYHTYVLDWQEDQLQWTVDGDVKQTLLKSDTLTADGTMYKYPSTPSRVQLSIWPAGINTSAQGTIDWAGGNIDWSSDEYLQNGYYRVQVQSVSIECATTDTTNASSISYQYVLLNGTEGKPFTETSSKSPIVVSAGWRKAVPSLEMVLAVALVCVL